MGRRSLVLGMAALLATGYAYGIVRANYNESYSHFIFDAGCLGLYVSTWQKKYDLVQRLRVRNLWRWVIALGAWPMLLFLIPIQDPLIQLVGLRGAVFFLPIILLGGLITDEDLHILALCVAGLNLVVFGFGAAEYFRGIEAFYPHNAVTTVIYIQRDVLAGRIATYRIPATFPSPAAYGAAMVMSMPLLVGAWLQANRSPWRRNFLLAAIFASAMGVFLSASRSQAAIMFLLGAVLVLSGRLPVRRSLAWLVIIAGIVWLVGSSGRLQRFTQLQDTSLVGTRVSVSANVSFLEMAERYPLGNGLGGGGTSIPYFLKDRLHNPVVMENEYARLTLEEGVPGLLLWIGFIVWVLTRPAARTSDTWFVTRRLGWFLCLAYFGTAFIGLGLLNAVPNAAMLLMYAGWVAAPQLGSVGVGAATEAEESVDWRMARRRYGW